MLSCNPFTTKKQQKEKTNKGRTRLDSTGKIGQNRDLLTCKNVVITIFAFILEAKTNIQRQIILAWGDSLKVRKLGRRIERKTHE